MKNDKIICANQIHALTYQYPMIYIFSRLMIDFQSSRKSVKINFVLAFILILLQLVNLNSLCCIIKHEL